MWARQNFTGQHNLGYEENTTQDAQKGRPARPQTKLTDFFSILLGLYRSGLHAADELCDVCCVQERRAARRSGENHRDLSQP